MAILDRIALVSNLRQARPRWYRAELRPKSWLDGVTLQGVDMSDDVRLALFDREFVMNVGDSPLPEKDLPVTRWLDPGWTPKRPAKTTFHCFDEDAIAEVMRLVTFKTCAFCRTPMYEFPKDFQPGIVLLCDSCGYWGGRGTREWGYGPCNTRGILGRYRPLTGYDGIPADVLLRHLRRHPEGMRELSPRKAEQFVMDLLKEALNCDVKLMGGVKDHGVDGFALRRSRLCRR